MGDPDRHLPDPGHEEPACASCNGTGRTRSGVAIVRFGSECLVCRGTGRPRCPDCDHGTVRTGPGRGDEEECEPHYDLTPGRREDAELAGAVFVPAKEQARRRIAARQTKRPEARGPRDAAGGE